MTDSPRSHRDLVRALIRAVDDADHNALAALTAKDVHFRFGNAAPTNTQSELLAAARSFRDAIADGPERLIGGQVRPRRTAFEAFWHDYPTDALMSKSKAFEKWARLGAEDRAAAHASLPAFRAHCARDLTYRPVHAERFLSQRRFDGFIERATPTPNCDNTWISISAV